MVMQGLGLAIVNPLTALMPGRGGADSKVALVVRPFSVSIPYEISLVRPLYRAASTQAETMSKAIQAEAQELSKRLIDLLCSQDGTPPDC
jgi:hypothetical protein